jgi:hypothetical protein
MLAGCLSWLEILDGYGGYAEYYCLAMLVLLCAKIGNSAWLFLICWPVGNAGYAG